MPRTLLVAFLALAALLLLTVPTPGQAPGLLPPPAGAQTPGLLPPPKPLPNPPAATTYFAGPGVVYFSSPKYTFQAGTNLPATVYPPGYMGGYGLGGYGFGGFGFIGGYGNLGGRGMGARGVRLQGMGMRGMGMRGMGMRGMGLQGIGTFMVPAYQPSAGFP